MDEPLPLERVHEFFNRLYPSLSTKDILQIFELDPLYAFKGVARIDERKESINLLGSIGRGEGEDYIVGLSFEANSIKIDMLKAGNVKARLGNSRILFNNIEKLAVRANVEYLFVDADCETGGYIWAALGFVPSTSKDLNSIKAHAASMLGSFDKSIDPSEYAFLREEINALTPVRLSDFSQLGRGATNGLDKEITVPMDPRRPEAGTVHAGAYLLAGSFWHGIKYMPARDYTPT